MAQSQSHPESRNHKTETRKIQNKDIEKNTNKTSKNDVREEINNIVIKGDDTKDIKTAPFWTNHSNTKNVMIKQQETLEVDEGERDIFIKH